MMFADNRCEHIPVKLNVAGCPLIFQTSSALKKDFVLRFGAHVEGCSPVHKQLKINNQSGNGASRELFVAFILAIQ